MIRKVISGLIPFLLLAGALAHGDAIQKHPRVADLEDHLTQEAMGYLKARFPDRPFLVTVSIDPLRRTETERDVKNDSDNKLPFFDMASEEIRDEWDDPQVSLQQLLLRVKRVSVSVSLPSSITDDEVSEVKTSLMTFLHLTAARDEIVLTRKDWSRDGIRWLYGGAVLAFLFILLSGMYLITRNSSQRIATAMASVKSGGGGGNVNVTAQVSGGSSGSPGGDKGKLEGDFRFSDPIKLREIIGKSIEAVLTSRGFPDHHDMVLLDSFGRRNSKGLGALLKEFPLETQKKLFAYSSDPNWMEAFHRPGMVSLECLDVLQSLSHQVREESSPEWKELLMRVWRLDDRRTSFFRDIKQEETFAILADLPKSVSVPTARKRFPGSWASLLDPTFKPAAVPKERVKALMAQALELLPLNDFSKLNQYRNESELLEFLRDATISEERDVYGVLPSDSTLHKLRLPFYLVMDQTTEITQALVQRASIENWALALFNVNREERKRVETSFSEKQKFMFIERLRQFDASPPDRARIAEARQKIATKLHELLLENPGNGGAKAQQSPVDGAGEGQSEKKDKAA